jgi:putative membrane protein
MRVNPPRHLSASIIIAAGIVLAACNGQEASARSANSAKASDTTSAAAVAPTPAVLTDANIVWLLDEANMADSSLGSDALAVATSKDTRDFAKMMMGEHHALRVKGESLVKKTGISPQMPTDDPFKSAVDAERAAVQSAVKGRALDSTYIAQEIGIHSAVISWANSAGEQAQNSELKDLIKAAAPVLKKHLDRAQEIQKKLSM